MTSIREAKNNTQIRMLVMDIDGTLTDGQIHISSQGELFKSFDVKDGYGIRKMLPQNGIIPVVITGRSSMIAERRCMELGIKLLYQEVDDKADCLRTVAENLGIPLKQTACIGDDMNDLSMMTICGISGCPADAAESVKGQCTFVSKYPGGHGAVREFIEWIIKGIG